MMKRMFAYLLCALLLLVLPGCSAQSGVSLPSHPPSSVMPTPSPSLSVSPSLSPFPLPSLLVSTLPSPTDAVVVNEPGEDGDDSSASILIDPDSQGWTSGLPFPSPEISKADKAVFDPENVHDYLVAYGDVEPYCTIDHAEMKDGHLWVYVTTYGSITPEDAYSVLSSEFHLPDQQIFALPLFSDYCMQDGEVYQKEVWDNIQEYGRDNLEPFELESQDIDLDVVCEKQPFRVADDAEIWFLDDTMEPFNYQVQVKDFVSKFQSHAFYYDIFFKYNDGKITGILEAYVDDCEV